MGFTWAQLGNTKISILEVDTICVWKLLIWDYVQIHHSPRGQWVPTLPSITCSAWQQSWCLFGYQYYLFTCWIISINLKWDLYRSLHHSIILRSWYRLLKTFKEKTPTHRHTHTYIYSQANIIVADDLVTQEARASAGIVLSWIFHTLHCNNLEKWYGINCTNLFEKVWGFHIQLTATFTVMNGSVFTLILLQHFASHKDRDHLACGKPLLIGLEMGKHTGIKSSQADLCSMNELWKKKKKKNVHALK